MNKGDVVEVSWPFSDLSGSKKRPAVVLQADFLNGILDDTILVKITSRKYGIPGTEVELDPADEQLAGFRKKCYVSCKDVLTRDQALIGPTLGSLSITALEKIEACLKIILEIT